MTKIVKKVVTIGGGSGHYVLLSGLRDLPNMDITAIVSMVDSGGSTGRLRDELGVLPPGDILKCILALSPNREWAREFLLKRFSSNKRLKGHNAGNFLLTILSQYTGSFPAGVEALSEILGIKGQVLPITINRATLVAELTNGEMLYGESAIDVPRGDQREKIKRTFLVPHHTVQIKVYPPVVKAINNANYIIIGPGDLYTSITPNFLVSGARKAIKKTKAKIIYIANIMTKFGETDNFSIYDFVSSLESFIKRKVDVVIANSYSPSLKILAQYQKQKSFLVKAPREQEWEGRKIIKANLINVKGGILRHDSRKLASLINKILK